MTRHHWRHPLGFLLPKPSAAFDVREQERDGSLFRQVIRVPSQSRADVTAALAWAEAAVLPLRALAYANANASASLAIEADNETIPW